MHWPSLFTSGTFWAAVSGVAAVVAIVISVCTQRRQNRNDEKQAEIQERLAKIEEERYKREIEDHVKEQQAASITNVRVCSFVLEVPGRSKESDRVGITIENQGPAVATNIDIAQMEDNDRALGSHLGELVEQIDANKSYFQIPWELGTPRPLGRLSAGEQITLSFWLRYRLIGNVGLRVSWEDGRGPQVNKSYILFEGLK
jgi:hypothetical protein